MKRLTSLVIILLAAITVIAGSQKLRLSEDSEPIGSINEPLHILTPATTNIVQTFTSNGQTISGLTFYSKSEPTHPGSLQVVIKNTSGHIIAHGQGQGTQTKSGLTKITVPTNWFTPKLKEIDTIEVTSLDPKLTIVATGDGEYGGGALQEPKSADLADLSFALIHPTPLSFGQKQGISIALAFTLAAALIQLYGPSSKRPTSIWIMNGLLLAATGVMMGLPLFWPEGSWGIGDWDYRFSLNDIYRQTILTHHQFPVWNPYMCGGAAALGDPEFSIFTPVFASILAFGAPTGFKIGLSSSFIICSIGTLVLGKKLGFTPAGALLAALVFTFNGAFILKLVEGHVTIIFAYMWLPWVCWSWLAAYRTDPKQRQARWARMFLCALFLTFMLLTGGIYILSYTLPLLWLLPLFTSKRGHAYKTTALIFIAFFGLSAFQLLPSVAWVREFPDPSYVNSTSTLTHLVDVFFIRHGHGSNVLAAQLSGWHEYGAYVGYTAFALALLGLSGKQNRRLTLALTAAIAACLLLASAGPSLAPMFDAIPFIPRSNISRLAFLAAAGGAILAGRAVSSLRLFAISPLIPLAVTGLVAGDLMSFAYPELEKTFSLPAVMLPIVPAPYPLAYTTNTFTWRSRGQDYERSYAYTKAGYGTFTFCTVIGPSSHVVADEPDAKSPFILQGGPQGQTSLTNWTPNHFTIRYNSPTAQKIVVNANYASGWRASQGQILQTEGRLGVEVPAGIGETSLSYNPPALKAGLIVTALTVLAMVLLLNPRFSPGKPHH